MKITKKRVESLKPMEKDAFSWDTEIRGFGVKVTPKGRKTYVFQYRLGGRRGRTRRITIGTHGHITTEQARREATKLAGQVAAGQDVAAENRKHNTAPRISDIIDIFMRDHVEAKLKLSTRKSYECLVDRHIKPALGNLKIDIVNRRDIAKFHHKMKETPYHANRALAFLKKMLSWSENHGYREHGSNPCFGIEKYREHKREQFLNDTQLQAVGIALTTLQKQGEISEHAAAAIQLLLLTGCRLREILNLRWSEVDFDRQMLLLEDSKTGRRPVVLNEAALDVLHNIKRIEGNPHVCCGRRNGRPLVNLSKPWKRVCQKANLTNMRIHDLRHTHASVAAAEGLSLPIIGSLLGHTQAQTTARYSHLTESPVRNASEVIGARIASAMRKSPGLALVKGARP